MNVISCHIKHHIATLTLTNERLGNALGEEFWRELPQYIEALKINADVRVVVIQSDGKHFSVGIDLAYAKQRFMGPTDTQGRAVRVAEIEAMQDALLAVDMLEIPVIVAIQGACIGAGIELATCADFRLCSKDSLFSLREIRLGIIPDLGGLQRLPRQIPAAIANELILTGRDFTATEAQQWLWVNNVFDDGEKTQQAAQQLAKELATLAPRAMSYIKQSLKAKTIHSDKMAMRALIAPQIDECISEDIIEAMQAQRDKRQAMFKPRNTL